MAWKTLTDPGLFKYIMWSDRAIFRARLEPLELFGAEIGRQFFPQRIPGPIYPWLTAILFPEGQDISRGWQILNILSIGSIAGLAIAAALRFSLITGLVTLTVLLGNLMMTSSLTRTYWNPSWLIISTCGLLTAALMMWRQKSRMALYTGSALAVLMIVIGTSVHLTFFIPAILIALVLIADAALYRYQEIRRSWLDWLLILAPMIVILCIGGFWSVALDFSNIQPSAEENAVTFSENLIAIAKLLADHANINFTDNLDAGNHLSAARYFLLFLLLNAPNYIILALTICLSVVGSWQFVLSLKTTSRNSHPIYLTATVALIVVLLISSSTFTAKPRYIYYLWVILSVAFAAGLAARLQRTDTPIGFVLAGYGLLVWAAFANIYNHRLINEHYTWTQQQHTAALQTYRNASRLVEEIREQGLTDPSDIRMGAGLFLDIGGAFEFIDSNQASAIDMLIGYTRPVLSEPLTCLAIFISDKAVSPEAAAATLRRQLAKHGAESMPTEIHSSGNRLFITYPPYQGACLRTLTNYYTDRYLFRKVMTRDKVAGPFRIDDILPVELGISFREDIGRNSMTVAIFGDLNGYRGFMTPYAKRLVLELRQEGNVTTTQPEFPEIIGLDGFLLPLTSQPFPRQCGDWTVTLKVFGFGYIETPRKSDHTFTDSVRFCD
ncbi:MAG: hypothetical protein RIC36_01010 [Rhodospirillales bacterium]